MSYIRHLREVAAGRKSEHDTDFDLTEERARLAHHQANKTALEEAEKRGELVSVEDVIKVWTGQIAACRAKLLSLPTKLAPVAAIESDAHTIEELITDTVHEALNELSELGLSDETRKRLETGD